MYGLKYDVIPPGKTYVGIEHLSGGQKTICALSLLFAIHSYGQTPFIIMDEIDSNLDSINVLAVQRYVTSKSEIQFIIITLKSNLCTKADTITGINALCSL